ncbi:uncharacterized protein [Amphiura filiformis]|uniref:uncharacterized protein n=1 Tax=Amphiura filiformis TaxID=82378 RepID=UPI003B20F4CC
MNSEKCIQQNSDLSSNMQGIESCKNNSDPALAAHATSEEIANTKTEACAVPASFRKAIKPPAVKSLVSMCASIASDRADLVSVDRLISLLDKTVSEMRPGAVLPEMKWMLLDTILFVADSPENFPAKVRQGILEAALGCEVFDAQRTMIQKRLFAAWDRACWECDATEDAPMQARHPHEFEVYSTERLRGEPRCHTLSSYQNFILNHSSSPSTSEHEHYNFKNKEFTRWWWEHDLNTRRAFLTSDQETINYAVQ